MINLGVKVFKTDILQSFDTLQLLEKSYFSSKIGSLEGHQPSYLLLQDPANIFFSAKIPDTHNYDKSLNPGQFKADLWKQDLVELFIASDQGNSYQEFNLAPSGAYWTVKFSDYRVRIAESEQACANIKTECRTTISGKILSIQIPLSEIIDSCAFTSQSRVSCCAILGKDPRNYFSTANLDLEKPDFHKISSWTNLDITPAQFQL